MINLFLEIFGQCEVRTDNLHEIFKAPVQHINWEILPRGTWPWENLLGQLEPIIKEAPEGNRELIADRWETLNGYQPQFYALGRAGFRGYIVFGFPDQHLQVLESIFSGNATYIFGDDWQRLSQMTKAEVLNDHCQKDRIIHRAGWHRRVEGLLTLAPLASVQ